MPYFGLLPHPFPAFPPYVVRTTHIRGMRTTDVTNPSNPALYVKTLHIRGRAELQDTTHEAEAVL